MGSILLALIWYRLGLSSMHMAVNARCITAGNSGNIASFGFARHRGLLRCTGATAAVASSRSQCRARVLISRAHDVGSDGVPTVPGPKTRRRRQHKQSTSADDGGVQQDPQSSMQRPPQQPTDQQQERKRRRSQPQPQQQQQPQQLSTPQAKRQQVTSQPAAFQQRSTPGAKRQQQQQQHSHSEAHPAQQQQQAVHDRQLQPHQQQQQQPELTAVHPEAAKAGKLNSSTQQQSSQQQQRPKQWSAAPTGASRRDQHMGRNNSASSSTRATGSYSNSSSSSSRLHPRQLTAMMKATHNPQQLLQLIQQHGAAMDHIHVSALFTRAKAMCGQSRLQQPAMQQALQQMQRLAMRVQQQCAARELSNIIWSCGYMSRPGVVSLLLPSLLQRQVLQHANPQDLSNTLLGVVKSGAALRRDQLQQMLKALTCQLADANAQDISNTLWAVATMGQQLEQTQLQQLLTALTDQLADANPQSLSNTLWAVATMGKELDSDQLQQLLTAFTNQLAAAKPQEISNTLWAVATMKQPMTTQQLQELSETISSKVASAKLQEVSNTLWACAEQQFVPMQLLTVLSSEQEEQQQVLLRMVTAAPLIDLAGSACACGQLGYSSQLLPGVLLQEAVQRCQRGVFNISNPQHLANLCWSAAVLDQRQHVSIVMQLTAACSTVWDGVQAEDLLQLYQVHLWLSDTGVSRGLSGVLTPQQLQQCKEQWELLLKQATAAIKASRLQRQVFAALQQLPPTTWQQQPVMEQQTADGAFSIDIAVTTAAGTQVAVEVDGPSHFLRPDNTLEGPTQSRNRSLAARGWSVVSVPYFEWDKLKAGQQQQAYLLAKLQSAGNGRGVLASTSS